MTFIQHRQRHTEVEYNLVFSDRNCQGAAYSFPCDEQGNVASGINQNSWMLAHDSTRYAEPYIRRYEHTWAEPAVLRCECGAAVTLDDAMTNSCDRCHTFYNGSGQRLAHPSQWGEETGERFDDNGREVF